MNIKSLDIPAHYMLFFKKALKMNTFINFIKEHLTIQI